MNRIVGASLLLLSCALSSLAQGYPPPGFEIVDVTRDPEMHHAKYDLNNCGQIVYYALSIRSWEYQEVYWYDNGRTTQITDNEYGDVGARITDDGTIYWLRAIRLPGVSQFMSWQNGGEVLLAEHDQGVWGRALNDQGQYAWTAYVGSECSTTLVVFFDGEENRILTDDGFSRQSLDMNDRGELVWVEYDFCSDPRGIDVVHYHDGVFTEIGAEFDNASSPKINERSQVVYSSRNEGEDWAITLWEDGVSRRVLSPPVTTANINNLGDIAFGRWPLPEGEYKQLWVYHGDTEEAIQMTNDSFHNAAWAINDYREVVMGSSELGDNWQVRMLRRIRTGDSEFDGDVDHDDLERLVECMTGPMWVERTNPGPEDSLCECRFLDINHDGSVDLRDYAVFQRNFAQ